MGILSGCHHAPYALGSVYFYFYPRLGSVGFLRAIGRVSLGYFVAVSLCPHYAIGSVYFDLYSRLGIGWFVASHGWVREP